MLPQRFERCARRFPNLEWQEKVDVFELAVQYPEAFARAYDPASGQMYSEFIVQE
ncbi:MAG: hypothetical protein Q4E12_05585 [Coriobacteriia bacterium]|nr:hypothetical protein [Coriobacteriia bacterium]